MVGAWIDGFRAELEAIQRRAAHMAARELRVRMMPEGPEKAVAQAALETERAHERKLDEIRTAASASRCTCSRGSGPGWGIGGFLFGWLLGGGGR